MADALVSGFNPFAGNWLEGSGPSQIELAEFAESLLRQSSWSARSCSWQIVTPAIFGIVTFRFVPEDCSEDEINEIHRRTVEAMTEDGFAFANSTSLRGQTVLRLCTINPRTTREDIRATVERIETLACGLWRKLKKP